VIKSFILGAMTGGAIVWVWGPQIKRYVDERTHTIRTRVADSLQTTAQTLHAAAETVEEGLSGPARAESKEPRRPHVITRPE
jgi:hypothetical protein